MYGVPRYQRRGSCRPGSGKRQVSRVGHLFAQGSVGRGRPGRWESKDFQACGGFCGLLFYLTMGSGEGTASGRMGKGTFGYEGGLFPWDPAD